METNTQYYEQLNRDRSDIILAVYHTVNAEASVKMKQALTEFDNKYRKSPEYVELLEILAKITELTRALEGIKSNFWYTSTRNKLQKDKKVLEEQLADKRNTICSEHYKKESRLGDLQYPNTNVQDIYDVRKEQELEDIDVSFPVVKGKLILALSDGKKRTFEDLVKIAR